MKTIDRILAVALFCFVAVTVGSVSAQDYGNRPSQYTGYHGNDDCPPQYQTIYVTRTVPYQVKVCKYHPCGTPYYVWVTRYKTLRVPVRIPVSR